jgi:hypothetical protein
MTWERLLAEGRVERLATSPEEVRALQALAERSLADARLEALSVDGRFGLAYGAARAVATVVVRVAGYRVRSHGGGHFNTFLSLQAADPKQFGWFGAYFNRCREKRNDLSYESVGIVSAAEAEELIREVVRFSALVRQWLRSRSVDPES